MRLDHIASRIVNANHGSVRADEKLTASVELESAIRACPLISKVRSKNEARRSKKQPGA
jgi:hypothetical protein